MHTPDEAVDELEHAARSSASGRGAWPASCSARSRRSADADPELAQYAVWTDTFGLDSAYDYDPVWQKCRELGIAPAFHSAADGLAEPGVDLELRVQPRRHARREPPRAGQVAVPRRRHPPLPRPQLRVPRGRRGVGGRRSTPTSSGTGRSATATRMRRLDPDARRPGRVRRAASRATAASGRRWRRPPTTLPGRRTSTRSTSSRRAASSGRRTSASCSVPLLLRLRGRRPA